MCFNVTILQPPGYTPSLVFLEAAEHVLHILRRLGHKADFHKNRILPGVVNVVFGAHLKMPEQIQYPKETVIFNTEQLTSNSSFVDQDYLKLLDTHYVWDYSQSNLSALHHDHKSEFPFTYVPELERLTSPETKKFDLVFYGSMNARRQSILEALAARGVKINVVNGLFAADRDAIMMQGRALLNLHYYDSQVFQQIRCFYPLINGIPVISENFPLNSAPKIYQDAILTPGEEDFVDYTVELLRDQERCENASKKAITAFKTYDCTDQLEGIVDHTLRYLAVDEGAPLPASFWENVSIGSGANYRLNWLNLDILGGGHGDISLDLECIHEFPVSVQHPLLGEVELRHSMCRIIDTHDVMASVPNLDQFLTNCVKILREGGELRAKLPYDLGSEAWSNASYRRAFNHNSWRRYTQTPWELGWREWGLEQGDTHFHLSPLGVQLKAEGAQLEKLLNTPRAVDTMTLTLRKRQLTPVERTLALSSALDWASLN